MSSYTVNIVNNRLLVVHIPQIPMKAFEIEVKNEREAYLVINALADQHCFLFDNNVIPDYSNVIFIAMFDEDENMDWDEFIEEYSDYVNGK